jgi:hypothetical protein
LPHHVANANLDAAHIECSARVLAATVDLGGLDDIAVPQRRFTNVVRPDLHASPTTSSPSEASVAAPRIRKGMLAVENDQAATVLACGVPLPPRSTNQRVAVKEDRGFHIRECLKLLSLLVIDGNRITTFGVIPSDELPVCPR